MYKFALSKFQFGMLLFAMVLFTACPPERDFLYRISEPVMMAFTHQINFDSLKNEMEKDTFSEILSLENGIQLSGQSGRGLAYDLWLNDSLLIVKIKGFYVGRRDGVNANSGKVLFELKKRKERIQLFKDFPKIIAQSNFENKNFHPRYIDNGSHRIDAVSIPIGKLTPVNSLKWNGSLLSEEGKIDGQFYFENGVLQDTFTMRDSIRSILVKGIFEKGVAIGEWRYFDLDGKLQWQETYHAGELIDLNKQKYALRNREARLLTVKELLLLHRITFCMFLILFGLIFWHYLKSFRKFTFPHRKMGKWNLLGWLLFSPFVSSGTLILYICLSFFLFIFLQTFGWDLPFDVLSMIFSCLVFYFPIGVLNFIGTLRFQDLFWHAGLLTLGLFIFKSYLFLKNIGIAIS